VGRPPKSKSDSLNDQNDAVPKLADWKSMVFVSRYKNCRVLDPKHLKRLDRQTGETVYGTEMVFREVGPIGIYKPKSKREAEILLETPNVELQGATAIPSPVPGEVVGVVTAPLPANVTAGKPA
jgi:hypothetical protein